MFMITSLPFAYRLAILHDIGLTKENKLVEVQRDDLVGEHVGSTEAKTNKKISQARGGILSVDEAYQLNRDGSKVDFGYEAVGVLMKHLNQEETAKKDKTVFILAGYEKEMRKFMAMNRGLFHRFREPVLFRDYSPKELVDIMESLARKQGFQFEGGQLTWADFFAAIPAGYRALFNGALCARALGKVKEALSERVAFNTVRAEDLFTLTIADYDKALASLIRESNFAVTTPTKLHKSTQVEEGDFTLSSV